MSLSRAEVSGMSSLARAATRKRLSSGARGPQVDDCWRGIVLLGRHAATYKFALARALLDLKAHGGQIIKLEKLALPFANHVCSHLRFAGKQGTASRSRFLIACKNANEGQIDQNQLIEQTLRFGFQNVIDAFHNVGGADIPHRFFSDERSSNSGIRITDAFSHLLDGVHQGTLIAETEARWRLVETAWELGLCSSQLVVHHDGTLGELFMLDRRMRRRNMTGVVAALSGYQRGRCFYCHDPLHLRGVNLVDVDHFFPHLLKRLGWCERVDEIWNLVLSCEDCNRGPGGKAVRVPSQRLLARLHARNEYLIRSHHPLRETLMNQTGLREVHRRSFLSSCHQDAQSKLIHVWEYQDTEARDRARIGRRSRN